MTANHTQAVEAAAGQVPIEEMLLNVPSDARLIYEHSPTHSQSIPVGMLCKAALAEIYALRAALTSQQEVAAEVGDAEVLVCRLCNVRAMAATRLPKVDVQAIDDAMAFIAAASRPPAAGVAGGVDAKGLNEVMALALLDGAEIVHPATQARPSPHPAVGEAVDELYEAAWGRFPTPNGRADVGEGE